MKKKTVKFRTNLPGSLRTKRNNGVSTKIEKEYAPIWHSEIPESIEDWVKVNNAGISGEFTPTISETDFNRKNLLSNISINIEEAETVVHKPEELYPNPPPISNKSELSLYIQMELLKRQERKALLKGGGDHPIAIIDLLPNDKVDMYKKWLKSMLGDGTTEVSDRIQISDEVTGKIDSIIEDGRLNISIRPLTLTESCRATAAHDLDVKK